MWGHAAFSLENCCPRPWKTLSTTGRTLFLKSYLSCSSFFQDCGNMACMFYDLLCSHRMIYDPGCFYGIFFYGLVCVCMILDVLWSCMILYDFLWFHICVFFIYSSMILYILVCAYVILCVLIWCSFMIIYDIVLWSCIFCAVLIFMILYIQWCSLDVFLWSCMFLYVLKWLSSMMMYLQWSCVFFVFVY